MAGHVRFRVLVPFCGAFSEVSMMVSLIAGGIQICLVMRIVRINLALHHLI